MWEKGKVEAVEVTQEFKSLGIPSPTYTFVSSAFGPPSLSSCCCRRLCFEVVVGIVGGSDLGASASPRHQTIIPQRQVSMLDDDAT